MSSEAAHYERTIAENFSSVASAVTEGRELIQNRFNVHREYQMGICIFSVLLLAIPASLFLILDQMSITSIAIMTALIAAASVIEIVFFFFVISLVRLLHSNRECIARLRSVLTASVGRGLALLDTKQLNEFESLGFELKLVEAKNSIEMASALVRK